MPPYRLTTKAGSVTVLPRHGAKVVSLRGPGGREWLAPPARPLHRLGASPGAWRDHDCSGWDECFPNIGADEAHGLADHGGIWSVPWRVSQQTDQIRTWCDGPTGSRFERTLRLGVEEGISTLTAQYRVHAGATNDLPAWAWAQHVLLAANPKMRVLMPAPVPVRLEAGFLNDQPTHDTEWLAPAGVLGRDTDLAAAPGRAAKLWIEPPLPASVTVISGGDWLTWRLDRSTIPHLGLWVNLGGWHAGTASR